MYIIQKTHTHINVVLIRKHISTNKTAFVCCLCACVCVRLGCCITFSFVRSEQKFTKGLERESAECYLSQRERTTIYVYCSRTCVALNEKMKNRKKNPNKFIHIAGRQHIRLLKKIRHKPKPMQFMDLNKKKKKKSSIHILHFRIVHVGNTPSSHNTHTA